MRNRILKSALTITIALLFVNQYGPTGSFDDTVSLQTMLDAGNVTLPSGHAPYVITSALNVTHSFNLNGNAITCNQATGPAIKLSATSSSISNGTLNGGWDYTTAYNIGAPYAIAMKGTNTTVSNIYATQWAGYGINCGPYGGLSVIGCTLDKIGYMAFFYDPESLTTLAGGYFINNLVDRSMLNPATVTQNGVAIRGSTSSGRTISNWTISGNTIKMPYSPTDYSAACMEIRYCNHCTIASNVVIGGTLGVSDIADNYNVITNNSVSNVKTAGIETGGTHVQSSLNSVRNCIQDGFLIDGSSNHSSFTSDTSKGCGQSAFHIVQSSINTTITNCVVQCNTQKVISMANSDTLTVVGTSIDGQSHSGSSGIFLDHCPGNVSMTACAFKNLTCAITGYSTISGYGADHIIGLNCTFTSVGSQFCSSFTSPGVFGTSVRFTTYTPPPPPAGVLLYKGYRYIQSNH